MENDDEQIKSLIAGGTIGAALGALLTGKSSGAGIGAIAGAAIFASLQAKENASKLNISRIIEKNHALYEVSPDGSETFIKVLPKNSKKIPKKFKLD